VTREIERICRKAHTSINKANCFLASSSMLSVTQEDEPAEYSSIDIGQEKLNEAIMMLNKNLQEINIQNMDTELVAQMFKNYQSNVLFHLEGNDRG
jgi:DASH complex subunit DAD4